MITLTVILIIKLKKARKEIKKLKEYLDERNAYLAESNATWEKIVDGWKEKNQGYFADICTLQKERRFWVRQIKAVVSEDKMKELYAERDNMLNEYCEGNNFKKCEHYYNW